MATLSIDIETFSGEDLTRVGVYKYAEVEDFEVLLFAYAFDDAPVSVIDVANDERIPDAVVSALTNPEIVKTAFNAQFERVCLDRFLGIQSVNWDCTMVRAWMLNIGGGLASVGDALGLSPDEAKLKEGKALIRLFSMYRRPTKAEPVARFTRAEKPVEWQLFKDYCQRDVEAERAIRQKLLRFDIPPVEQQLYTLDQKINDVGVRLDREMVENAITINQAQEDHYTAIYRKATGLENPNSLQELKRFILEQTRVNVASITKDNLSELIKKFDDYPNVVTALECREILRKTSVAKYKTMAEVLMEDGRSRGNMQFYGAYRTGRWAGRLIQVHNLPQNHLKDLDIARDVVAAGDFGLIRLLYDKPGDVLSQCIRPCIIPSKGHKFIVADFSAIEARVIAWLAGEDWVTDVFRSHGKIYEATAAKMLGVPFDSISKGSEERQKGKVATLALGYQGGVGALKAMGAVKMGIPEHELQSIVDAWRSANANIVTFWYDTGRAVTRAIGRHRDVEINQYLYCYVKDNILFIRLPSGRCLAYPKPKITDHHEWEGSQKIVYEERNRAGTGWMSCDTYGGRLVENIVQATARDCLAYAMLALDHAGYRIVMHVHDEVVIEVPTGTDALDDVCEIMGRELPWAPGLPLRADGYECDYYKKD